MLMQHHERERAKIISSALYLAALEHRRQLEIEFIAAGNKYREYADAVAAVDCAGGAWAIGDAFNNLAELTPSYPAWR